MAQDENANETKLRIGINNGHIVIELSRPTKQLLMTPFEAVQMSNQILSGAIKIVLESQKPKDS